MNISKKILSMLLVVATLLCFVNVGVAVSAATPDTQTLKPTAGETINIKFSVDDVYSVFGDITYTNGDLFSSITPSISPEDGQISKSRFIVAGSSPKDVVVTLKVTIKSDAAVGSKATVTFTYDRVDDKMGNGPEGLVKTVTVEVIEKEPVTPPSSSTPSSSNPSSSNPSSSTPSKFDLTELNKQIDIAQGLNKSDYTSESWSKLDSALKAAKNARKATSQSKIDTAAKNLKNAIENLVRIDNTLLSKLLEQVKEYLEKDDLSGVKDALIKAIEDAEAALKSGNQDSINQAYEKLAAAFDAYKAKLKELAQSDIVEVEKEVEVEPKYDFCNIWVHNLWLILFIVSAIINVVFVVLTIRYFNNRKKYADNMPLIDYDIDED